MREDLFKHLSTGNRPMLAFLRNLYNLILDEEKKQRRLYHKFDLKILSQLDYKGFLNQMDKFISSKYRAPKFSTY